MPTTDPLAAYTRSMRNTPVSQPIPGRTDQVPNSTGGYVFSVDDWSRLHRFLMIGTEGGTYYVGETELTVDNAQVVLRCLKEDGPRVVDHIRTVSLAGDAPKQKPLLFALALACAYGDDGTQAAAFAAVAAICRTATMLFEWNSYLEPLRGWGRRRQAAVAYWYQSMPGDKLAYQAVKYRQRAGWTHRDMLRLAKPKRPVEAHDAIYGWITGKKPASAYGGILEAFEEVQRDDTTVDRAVNLIGEHRLPWEALPTRLHAEPAVWDALMWHMGATALLRQLPRFARLGLLGGAFGDPPMPIRDLADQHRLRTSRIHPVAVLNALAGYSSGQSRSGGSHTVNPKVVEILDDAFHASFGSIVPAGKNTVVALDVSGSMTMGPLAMLPALTPRDASAAMAMATVRTEPNVLTVAFSQNLSQLAITKQTRLLDAVRIVSNLPFQWTDLSLPPRWAREAGIGDVDTFVVYTDNQVNAGTHPSQALEAYRQFSGRPTRMAVVAMTSTGFSIADPQDPGQLDVVGFDAATPTLLGAFSRGDL